MQREELWCWWLLNRLDKDKNHDQIVDRYDVAMVQVEWYAKAFVIHEISKPSVP